MRGVEDMDVIQDFYLHAYSNINGDKVFNEEGFNYGYVKRSLSNFIIDKYRHDTRSNKVQVNYNVDVVNMQESIDELEVECRKQKEEDLDILDKIESYFSSEEVQLIKLLLSSKLSSHVKREFIKETGSTDARLIWNKYMKEYHRAKKILNEMKSIKESLIN